jgi:hypothetical protein
MIQKDHVHPTTAQLIQEQDLIGVLPRQPVRRMNVQPIDDAQGCHITQSFQGRTNQGCAAIPVVDKDQFRVEFETLLLESFLQGLYLAGDGLSLRLLLGGDAGIEGSSCTRLGHYTAHRRFSTRL